MNTATLTPSLGALDGGPDLAHQLRTVERRRKLRSLALTLPSDGVGPLKPEMQQITTGHAVSYAQIPLAGNWTVLVTARPSKFVELRATFTVPIGE